ncbi:DsbA family protein [Maritimibacter sp. DP1N21-5]|uniref:DsbA family protein n=1 Tax=Maritimibacter sp. DP1N21-5 TaxID=2836867 RepID=UPI001C45D321|nr:DsbA family protein [Maritimibacter sp. DP1N21-5]MBV7409742.1 DsbA family protein [Maritimibacter sp. DP1N21-5]
MTRLVSAAAIALGLATAPAFSFDIESMSEDERATFREEIRAYLLENPEVLMEAIGVLENRQAEQQVADDQAMVENNANALLDDGYSLVVGNPEGDVTIVEFVDYRCGYCRKAFPEVNALVEEDGNIRLIYKEFPILGPESLTSSKFAIATNLVAGEEAYARMHDELMNLRANATEEVLARLADDMGLDSAAILAAMDDPEVERQIAENHALGQALQISGTPTFVFGDQMVRGYVPIDAMKEIVEELRGEG